LSGELSSYPDLSRLAGDLVEKTLPDTILQEGAHSDEAEDVSEKKIADFFNTQLNEIEALITKGQDRIKQLFMIADFQKKCLKALEALNVFADFKEKKAQIVKEVQALTLSKSSLRGQETHVVDEAFNAQKEHYFALQNNVRSFFVKL